MVLAAFHDILISIVDFGHFERIGLNGAAVGAVGLCTVGMILVNQFFPTAFDFAVAGVAENAEYLITVIQRRGLGADFEILANGFEIAVGKFDDGCYRTDNAEFGIAETTVGYGDFE